MVRTATMSKFDHVAMIFKGWFDNCPNEKVFILESVYGEGVRVIDWDYIKDDIGPGKFFQRVIYRSVDFNRKKNLQKLEDFARSV